MIIHVRNFGKIESADIDMSNFTIFVGENNSGKTYLMQLIYGVIDSLIVNANDFKFFAAYENIIKLDKEEVTIKAEDSEFFIIIQNCINKFLDNNKDMIIERIFHTKNLKIEALWIELNSLEYDYTFKLIKNGNLVNNGGGFTVSLPVYSGEYFGCDIIYGTNSVAKVDVGIGISINEIEECVNQVFFDLILTYDLNINDFIVGYAPILYLPASRSGIMLLYANYLANDMNNKVTVTHRKKNVENEYGLTAPVYDFLMFLLKHKESENLDEYKGKILDFINENIINGSLDKIGNTMRYTPESSDSSIPIYLSSSLVSELAPVCQVLSGINNIEYILYDEIETCQHPTKQLQLARMLIRMVNSGYKMIVSTHSDTMVAAINNLITLSYKKDSKKLAEELGYTEDDLLENFDVHAYQFKIDGVTGKTKVEEISSHFSLGVGFDFDIFNKTNDKIYQDAVKLAEVD